MCLQTEAVDGRRLGQRIRKKLGMDVLSQQVNAWLHDVLLKSGF